MMATQTTIRHIALVVPDLQAAEAYYRRLFGMSVIMREAMLGDDEWYSLPGGKDWSDARAAGIELGMVALQQGTFVLALFAGSASPGQVYAIGLDTTPETIADIRARLPRDTVILEDGPEALSFQDFYRITWQISTNKTPFRSSGEISGHWLGI
jgi:catechol 2,3-dioxygenase-like lactoylglutathione lyase family enzyme